MTTTPKGATHAEILETRFTERLEAMRQAFEADHRNIHRSLAQLQSAIASVTDRQQTDAKDLYSRIDQVSRTDWKLVLGALGVFITVAVAGASVLTSHIEGVQTQTELRDAGIREEISGNESRTNERFVAIREALRDEQEETDRDVQNLQHWARDHDSTVVKLNTDQSVRIEALERITRHLEHQIEQLIRNGRDGYTPEKETN